MKVLLVAATESEIEPTLSYINSLDNVGSLNGNAIHVLVTGVGMTATSFALGSALALTEYDLAINCGIAGAFDRSLKIGEVVSVTLDSFSELGAEDGEDFLSIDELGFGKSSIKPAGLYRSSFVSFKQVRSITVNTVHGNDESIYKTVERLNPQTESMEGAAFFYACNETDLSCLQLRAISNYIERRNRESWNIDLAVKNLNDKLIDLLKNLK
jgi:futalosine hydrolase